jgi:AcrR family transcriptional regulator
MTGRRGPYAKSATTRAQILAAASTLFASRGYLGTSLRQVGSAAGISAAGLLHHFADKETLLAAVIDDNESSPPTATVGSLPREELVRIVRDYVGSRTLLGTLAAEASMPTHPAHELFRARGERVRAELVTVLARLDDSGELRGDLPPSDVAVVILGYVDGLRLQAAREPGLFQRPDAVEHIVAIFAPKRRAA